MKSAFAPQDSAILLIDHQVGTIKLAISTPYAESLRNTRALTRAAAELKMPLVLTTSQEDMFQGRLLTDIERIAPEAHAARVRRTGVLMHGPSRLQGRSRSDAAQEAAHSGPH